MKAISVGIIGFGLSGRYFFAPFLTAHPQYRLKAVVSSKKDEVENLYPDIVVYAHVNELLFDDDIDLVVVASPNFTHFEYAKLALQAGKHVIVEKPFTVTTHEADELIDLSKGAFFYCLMRIKS